jgi:hypothetical protein
VAIVKELRRGAIAKVLVGDGRGLQLQLTAQPDVVRIEQGNPFSLGRVDAFVARRREARVLL